MNNKLEEHLIEDLDVSIKHKKAKLPTCNHPCLTPVFFIYTSIGQKHSGKTYSIVSLIKLYEEYGFKNNQGEDMPIKTILVSPTSNFSTNSIVYTLKSLNEDDVYDQEINEELLNKIFEQMKTEKKMAKDKQTYIKAYKKFLSTKDVMNLNNEEIMILSEYNFEKPASIFKDVKDYIYFWILDDLISDSNIFNQKRSSFISNLVIKHRHYEINLLFTTQHLKAMPKIIRNNTDILQFFKSSSNKTIDEMYEMVSNNLTKNEFLQLFEYSTAEKYSSLIVNNHPGSRYKYFKNWNTYLTINEKGIDKHLCK